MEGEDDDEVIKEIDVYLTHDPNNKFYIFQYPLKPPWRQNNFNLLEEMRMKPNAQKVEMDFKIDVNSEYYNEYKKDKPAKTTLTSSSVQHRTNYAIGLFSKDGIHLAPLHSILQFRPSFEYISDAKKKEKQEEKEEEAPATTAAPADDDEEGGSRRSRPISMQYKRRENPRFRHPLRKLEDEPWTKLQFLDVDAIQTEEIYNQLVSAPDTPIDVATSSTKYLDQICPPSNIHLSKAAESGQPSMELINKLPLEQQVKLLMVLGHILPFKKIEELATSSPSRKDLLQCLERYATMVRGVWTVKSEECCAPVLVPAHEYMLYKFNKSGTVSRKKFAAKTGLSDSLAREMLLKVADVQPAPARTWALRVPPDDDFNFAYPEYAPRYNKYWEEAGPIIKARLANSKTAQPATKAHPFAPAPRMVAPSGAPAPSMTPPNATSSSAAPAMASFTASSSSSSAPSSSPSSHVSVSGVGQLGVPFAASGDQTLFEEVHRFLLETFKNHPVCTVIYLRSKFMTQMSQRYTVDSNVRAPQWVSDATAIDEGIRAVLPQVCQKIGRVYALKALGDPEVDKFRAVVMKAYNVQTSLRKSDITELCQKELGQEIPLNTYNKIINELAYLNRGRWILKTGEG